MLETTAIVAIVAVVLAVAREVPILALILPPDTEYGQWSGVVCLPPFLAAMFFGGPVIQAARWIAGIA